MLGEGLYWSLSVGVPVGSAFGGAVWLCRCLTPVFETHVREGHLCGEKTRHALGQLPVTTGTSHHICSHKRLTMMSGKRGKIEDKSGRSEGMQ